MTLTAQLKQNPPVIQQPTGANCSPRINGARIVGARPSAPFLFQVPATGSGRLFYGETGLPKGLAIDSETGIISGSATESGEYPVELSVSNEFGSVQRALNIRIGQEICLAPPMGWNSWYAFSDSVTEESVRHTARAMVGKGLTAHGWGYVNIDDCWQGQRGGRFGAIQPNARFGNMKRLCDDLHALGLKAGIYSTPWMGTYAGFIGGSAPDNSGDYSSMALAEADRRQQHQYFGGYPAIKTNGVGKVGPAWLFDRDVLQWEEWGFDFVKVDWHPNDVQTASRIASDIRSAKRDIVFSISNGASLETANELSAIANMWRTTGDVFDNWESIRSVAAAQAPWQQFAKPGHWNDPDMLQVGMLGITNGADGHFYPTKLTQAEQMFQMSLWCMLSAPLMISCEVEALDEFTIGLLTNDALIDIDQDPAGIPAFRVEVEDVVVWVKRLFDGSTAVGFFNSGDAAKDAQVDFDTLGISGPHHAQNLWNANETAVIDGHIRAGIPPHSAVVYRLSNERSGR